MLAEQANEEAITVMVAKNLGIVDEQQTLYESMRITHDIRREQCRLRVLQVERDDLEEEEAQATVDEADSGEEE